MPELVISMQPRGGETAAELMFEYGNIADDVWKDALFLTRTAVVGDRVYSYMRILFGRPLRKRERDELQRRINLLASERPHLEPVVIFPAAE